jgi:tetratricopeptide (TPR) repeat protein
MAMLAGGLMLAGGCQSLDKVASRGTARPRPATVDKAHTGKAPAVSMSGAGESGAGARAGSSGAAPPVQAAPAEVVPGQANVARATVLQSQGFADQALAEFEKAIEINPKLTVAYLGAGDIYRQRGDYASAEKRYRAAAGLEPTNFQAQYLHALSLQLLDRFDEAVRAYLRALAIRPDDFNANLNLGTAYLQLGEPREGLPYAQKAIVLNAKNGPARTNLGAIYSALDRHAEAVVEFQQAAELTELTGPLLLNLANSLGRVGRYEEMVNTLEQLTKTEPTANAYERLGAGLFRLRRYDESLDAYRKAIEIDPNHYPALNGVGVCLMNQWIWSNQTDQAARTEALAAWRRSLQVESNQPKILELVGRYK